VDTKPKISTIDLPSAKAILFQMIFMEIWPTLRANPTMILVEIILKTWFLVTIMLIK
jgi:hypothetical protein